VFDPPIYTIDDDTGDLADPDISIYIRGTPDPTAADVRAMPDAHFMRDMADVRVALAQRPLETPSAEPESVPVGGNDIHPETSARTRGEYPVRRDERHLNQYLA